MSGPRRPDGLAIDPDPTGRGPGTECPDGYFYFATAGGCIPTAATVAARSAFDTELVHEDDATMAQVAGLAAVESGATAEVLAAEGADGTSADDYREEILAALGESTYVEPISFHLLAGYPLSMAGTTDSCGSTGVGLSFESHIVPSGYNGTRHTGVLVNDQFYTDGNSDLYLGYELRPYFTTGTGFAGSDTVGPRASDELGEPGETAFRSARTAFAAESQTEGFSGSDAFGTSGARGTSDEIFDSIMQLSGNIAITAMSANQYPGTDYGAILVEAPSLSTATVFGHVSFGEEPRFLGNSISQGTFLHDGPNGGYPTGPSRLTDPTGNPTQSGADTDHGLDTGPFSDNTYYRCNICPFYYNLAEQLALKQKFGFDGITYSRNPYLGTRQRMQEGVNEIITDILDDVLLRIDTTKFVNSNPLTNIKINRITTSETAEGPAYSPSGVGSTGATAAGISTSTDTGGGDYGY
jgi:hypothetical protein